MQDGANGILTSTKQTHIVSEGRTVTDTELMMFSALTGDFYPAHTNDIYAAKSLQKVRIAHAPLTFTLTEGLLLRSLGDILAQKTLTRLQDLKLVAPVKLHDTLIVEADVIESADSITVDRTATIQDSTVVLKARTVYSKPVEKRGQILSMENKKSDDVIKVGAEFWSPVFHITASEANLFSDLFFGPGLPESESKLLPAYVFSVIGGFSQNSSLGVALDKYARGREQLSLGYTNFGIARTILVGEPLRVATKTIAIRESKSRPGMEIITNHKSLVDNDGYEVSSLDHYEGKLWR